MEFPTAGQTTTEIARKHRGVIKRESKAPNMDHSQQFAQTTPSPSDLGKKNSLRGVLLPLRCHQQALNVIVLTNFPKWLGTVIARSSPTSRSVLRIDLTHRIKFQNALSCHCSVSREMTSGNKW